MENKDKVFQEKLIAFLQKLLKESKGYTKYRAVEILKGAGQDE